MVRHARTGGGAWRHPSSTSPRRSGIRARSLGGDPDDDSNHSQDRPGRRRGGRPAGRVHGQSPRGADHRTRPRRRHHRLVLVRELRQSDQAHDGAVGRPAARTRQRPELLPLRSRDPLRDEGRQQSRRGRGRHPPVPLPDRAAESRRVHRLGWRLAGHPADHRARRSRVRGAGPAPVLHGDRDPRRPALRPERRPQALRRADQRRAAHHAQLQRALRSGHLRPGQRHPRLRRHHRRSVLHRSRAPPSTRSTSGPKPVAAC